MKKSLFYFICVFFISLALYPLFQNSSSELFDQVLISAILILGIPHGAIDNVLMKRRTGWGPIRFYAFYLGLILINIALWFVYPAISLLFFLLISSYHFGQAQLSHHFKEKSALNNLTYLLWGNVALTSFFLFNAQEIRYYFQDFPSLKSIDFLFQPKVLGGFMVLNAAGLLISSIRCLKKEQIHIESVAIEIVILSMILFIAYLFHFLFGFAIFFVLLHAIPVLIQEFSELYNRSNLKNILSFFRLLSPFSLISLIGIFGLFYLKKLQIIELSYLFLILIATSSITLPHVWVMKKFYRD